MNRRLRHPTPILTALMLTAVITPAALRADETVARVDALVRDHWRQHDCQPAGPAEPHELVRRLSLDLIGRVPTSDESTELVALARDGQYDGLVDRLLDGPEFPLHFARVIDGWIQQRQAGDDAFVEWLRGALAERRSWDSLFRAMLVGPWESDAEKPANRFLLKRIKNLDSLAADASRAFFGVDITCARCHDHPLVSDWTQDHYYGMASFFNRATEVKKGSASIDEKPEGEVTFEARGGGQRTAQMMFLAGQTFPTAPKQNRREQLVAAALEQKNFLSRAVVNRTWEWFLGQGLVNPVDQMHSSNPPSVPGVLEFLADDFVARGYDLRHLVRSIARTQVYRLSSRHTGAAPPDEALAAARLKPLSPRQWAVSFELVTGPPTLMRDDDAKARGEKYRELEKRGAELLKSLDPTLEGYQASVLEALFLSNHAGVWKRFEPAGENLAARLAREPDGPARVDLAFRTVFGRAPSESERRAVVPLVEAPDGTADNTIADLLWTLVTSAEFRFAP